LLGEMTGKIFLPDYQVSFLFYINEASLQNLFFHYVRSIDLPNLKSTTLNVD
jgi:hypothetical protein